MGAPYAAATAIESGFQWEHGRGECAHANTTVFIDLRVGRKTSVESLLVSETWVAVVRRAFVGMLVMTVSHGRISRRRRLLGFVGRSVSTVLDFTSSGT